MRNVYTCIGGGYMWIQMNQKIGTLREWMLSYRVEKTARVVRLPIVACSLSDAVGQAKRLIGCTWGGLEFRVEEVETLGGS